MPTLYNHTDKIIRVKMGYEENWIEIPPDSEFVIGDLHANVYFGWGLEHEAQLKECWKRLRLLGNDITYEDFLKIYDSLTTDKPVKLGKRKHIE